MKLNTFMLVLMITTVPGCGEAGDEESSDTQIDLTATTDKIVRARNYAEIVPGDYIPTAEEISISTQCSNSLLQEAKSLEYFGERHTTRVADPGANFWGPMIDRGKEFYLVGSNLVAEKPDGSQFALQYECYFSKATRTVNFMFYEKRTR